MLTVALKNENVTTLGVDINPFMVGFFLIKSSI